MNAQRDDERVANEASAPSGETANGAAPQAEERQPTLEEQLAAERERAETYYRNWQRSAADFINYKRRVEQERSEAAKLANAALAINLLPVFDDLDRAVESVDAHLAGLNWVQGIIAIHRKFKALLESMGVTEIAAAGEPFDPNIHEAVAQEPGEEGKVLHVLQKGYRLGDRVLRPALVIVGSGQPPAGSAPEHSN
ncbi:MAG: nucleotide exchange factor GrpE [Chloroflexota bacterium]|nr:nucleotide exchange factor GrpE [Dehalococcoidia bacterium]MDW8046746.1 nucleotide exchange factor GrpE [Chloroflexota bacterium]